MSVKDGRIVRRRTEPPGEPEEEQAGNNPEEAPAPPPAQNVEGLLPLYDADIHCQACGNEEVATAFLNSCTWECRDECTGDHIHRTCQRCHRVWSERPLDQKTPEELAEDERQTEQWNQAMMGVWGGQ